jgi:hypothetical protein
MSIARVPSTIFFGAFSGLLFDFLSEIKLGKRRAGKGTLQPRTQIPIAIPRLSIPRAPAVIPTLPGARVQNAPPPRRRPPAHGAPGSPMTACHRTSAPHRRNVRHVDGRFPQTHHRRPVPARKSRRGGRAVHSPPRSRHTRRGAGTSPPATGTLHEEATGRPIDLPWPLALCQSDGQTRGSGTRGRSRSPDPSSISQSDAAGRGRLRINVAVGRIQ